MSISIEYMHKENWNLHDELVIVTQLELVLEYTDNASSIKRWIRNVTIYFHAPDR